jgi:polyribonucleotide nucleotidyltransferase
MEFGGKSLVLETGRLARQANASVLVTYGETQVLATVCVSSNSLEGIDFVPLTVEFAERFYASGKIPGSFHKREGRPTQEATLSARLIDRPIRPLFPAEWNREIQLVTTVLSLDPDADVDFVCSVAASAALHLSEVPFHGPTAGCRVGKLAGQWVLNPTWTQLESKDLEVELFVAGTKNAIMMVEGGAKEASEEAILEGILHAHQACGPIIALIEELRHKAGREKATVVHFVEEEVKKEAVRKLALEGIKVALQTKDKMKRKSLLAGVKQEVKTALVTAVETPEGKLLEKNVHTYFENLVYESMRNMILKDRTRIDGRKLDEIRPISVESQPLKRPHGSALFTRGETQVLSMVTLGTSEDEQIVDTMHQKAMRKFMLHYNFPKFCVGEVGRMGGQSRREIGHGALAEKSIKIMMPAYESFPYTVRIVCETLESNGSSSMGSVCSASMALMSAGVPFMKPVAGIAMGLIKEQAQVAVLSDILGDEDHLGDMDFKVAGTRDGVTGIQMDIKIEGVDRATLEVALSQAKQGRLHILDQMAKAIDKPNVDLSKYAPRITTMTVPVDKIRDVIGSGGKVIKDIIARTGCKVDIDDTGTIHIASSSGEASQKAIQMIKDLTAVVEVGKVYKGIVKKIADYGAFVGVLPNQDGLLHISELAHERVKSVTDFVKEGDEIEVIVLGIDQASGKVRLSRKALLPGGEMGSGDGHDSDRPMTPRRFEGRDSGARVVSKSAVRIDPKPKGD